MTGKTEDEADGPEVELTGGNMNTVLRRGDVVLRTAGPWTPTIHRLLRHLLARGIDWLPKPLGVDEHGRERLSFLPGRVPNYPLPAYVWTERVLSDSARRLAEVHRASADFDLAGASWQLPPHRPAEVICLNDVAPYNMVFDGAGELTGLIDVDTASPGPRVWDLAYLAYRLVPLSVAEDTGIGSLSLQLRRERLRLLCDAYAEAGDQTRLTPEAVLDTSVLRLEELADFTAERAAAGATELVSHVAIYRRDTDWIRAHLATLADGDERSGAL